MKSKLIFISIIVIISLCFYLLKVQTSVYNRKLNSTEVKHNSQFDSYRFSVLNNILNDNLHLPFDLELSQDDGSLEKLSSIVSEPKLIFRYSHLNCHACIDKQLELLNKYASNIDPRNIIIFTYYTNVRDLFLFKRFNDIPFQTYKVKSINIPLEELNFPYFFVLDKKFKVNDSFLPIKNDTTLTINYFSSISTKFENNFYAK